MPTNTIPLTTAVEYADTWRKNQGTYNSHHKCKGFEIPLDDLVQVLDEPGVTKVRAYLGVDENTYEEKLMFVGIDAQGNDMLDPDLGQYVYDMTRPCPPCCSSTGPLK